MKRIFLFMVVLFACVSCFDDSLLWESINDHESRISELEKICKEMNTNISSLQKLVNALQNNDYITNVSPVKDGGDVIGYVIDFSSGESITIYHGQDGKDGQDGAPGKDGEDGEDGKDGVDGVTPIIGVKKDVDGIYYWTLNGSWLLDDNGNKIKAEGKDGQNASDGVTPQLKIEDGYWYVSYDNGANWTQIGKATGDKGDQGEAGPQGPQGPQGTPGVDGDSMFLSIDDSEDYVVLTLYDSTTIVIPKYVELDISFDKESLLTIAPNSVRTINYTVTSTNSRVQIMIITSEDIKARVNVVDMNNKTGFIEIQTGDVVDEYSSLIVFVSDENNIIIRSFSFEQSKIEISNSAQKIISQEGGEINLDFFTNVEYDVIIPENVKTWISVVPNTRALSHEYITLSVSKNDINERTAIIKIKSKEDDDICVEFSIRQLFSDSEPLPNELWYYTVDNNLLTPYSEEGFNVKIVNNEFKDGLGIITFDGELTTIGKSAFWCCDNLLSVKIPNTVTSIQDHAFDRCVNLSTINIPNSVRTIGSYAFWGCESIDNIIVGESVEEYGTDVFDDCENLTTITFMSNKKFNISGIHGCPNLLSIKSKFSSDDDRCLIIDGKLIAFAPAGLSEYDFPEGINGIYSLNTNYLTYFSVPKSCTELGGCYGCNALAEFTVPLSIKTIANYAFSGCDGIQKIIIPYKVESVGEGAFRYCDNLTSASVYCDKVGDLMFQFCKNLSEVEMLNVKEIGTLAFANTNISEVVIPETVTMVGAGAFSCLNLKTVYIKAPTPPQVSLYFGFWQAFNYLENVGGIIYVPFESLELYKNAEYWSEYSDLYVGYSFE